MFDLSPSSPFWSTASLVAAAFFAVACVESHELLRDDGHSGGAGSFVQDATSGDEKLGASGGRGGAEAGGSGGSPSTDASSGSSTCPDVAPLTGSPCADFSSSPVFCPYQNRQIFCLCFPGQPWRCEPYPAFDSGGSCPIQPPSNMACIADQSCSYAGLNCTCERADAGIGEWRCSML